MERTSGEHISRFVEMPTDEETCWCKFLELRHYNILFTGKFWCAFFFKGLNAFFEILGS